jgi:three-Cys-motif partner protein
MPNKEDFFKEMSEQSEVKVEIVRKYFWAWAKVIIPQIKNNNNPRIGFVDLFAGRGRYEDGSKSTPILILVRAIKVSPISQMLVARFNDADPDNAQALEIEISKIPGIEMLKHKPMVRNFEVGDALADKFETWKIPTLFFVDPWGYKGLSLRLIKAVLRPWGCDCIFFFNYNRINAALSNSKFTANMNAMFSKERAEHIRSLLRGKTPVERQDIIIEGLKIALKDIGGEFSQEFCFKDSRGTRTSHFLIGVSKNVKGYDLMKSIMAKESSARDQGVPLFTYSPMDEDPIYLPGLSRLDDLKQMLLLEFAGRTMSMLEVFNEHHVGKGYVKSNYKEALMQLEEGKKIMANPPINERPHRNGIATFSDNVVITFPKRSGQ